MSDTGWEVVFNAAGGAEIMRRPPRNDVVSSDRTGVMQLFAPLVSSAGVPVTERTAMQVSTVYACLAKIGGAVTQLPLTQYRLDLQGNREPMSPTPLWWLLNESPAPAWTAASWKEWIVRCVHLRGDQFTQIERNGAAIAGFKVLHPDQVVVRLVQGRLRYDVFDWESGRAYGVDQDDMLHFSGFGFDGMRSLSVITYAARQSIGNSLAAADFTGRTLGEGAMPRVALTYPNEMSSEQKEWVRRTFGETYGGTSNLRLPLVLSEGGAVKELSLSPVDLQLLELRRFDREDICQAMGVPPIIIGESEKTSSWGTGIEQIMLGFVRLTVKPHTVRWAEELNRKLFRRAGQFIDFDFDAMLRGDAKSQGEFFRGALGGPGTGDGWMTKNEIRRIKNLPPKPGGDDLYIAQSKAPAAPPASATA